jgi:hypothetical protein
MAGWFDFVNGQTLPASRVQDYLMDQTVMVFADASARTTALTGIVSEGMVSYLLSTKNLWVYNGTAWVLVNPPEPPIVFPIVISPLLLMGA